MLDLVPLAGPGRKMTDRNGQAGGIGEGLQLQFPQAQPPAIAAPAVRRNPDRGGRRIEPSAFMAPPAPDGRHGKRARVVIRPDIDKPGVAPDIVDAIGIGPRHVGRGKVVPAHRPRLFRGPPLLAGVRVVADEFLLLGIHRDHRAALGQAAFHAGRDVAKLRVAVRVVASLLGLPVALEAVVEPVQQLRDLRVADRMVLPTQCVRDRPRALTDPAQRRFRVAPRLVLDHGFQGIHEPRVGHRDRFAPAAWAADAAGPDRGPRRRFRGAPWRSPCATVRTPDAPDSRPHTPTPALRSPP